MGQYRPLHKRETSADGTTQKHWTLPARNRRGVERLRAETIARHYRGRDVGDVIGFHAIGADGLARWLGVDFDNHEGSVVVAAENLARAAELVRWLGFYGVAAVIEDSDGRGGLHVWALFDRPADAALVYAFAQAVLVQVGATAETYPKQARVPVGRYGSWLRLPGRHHTRDHVSRFRDGDAWGDPADAPRLWLDAPRCDPTTMVQTAATLAAVERAVDPAPVVQPVPVPAPVARGTGDGLTIVTEAAPHAVDVRVRAYMTRLPLGLSAGQGRNHAGYRFACWLVRDMGIADGDALAYLAEWNRGHRTPMSTAKLEALLGDAHTYGQHATGAAGPSTLTVTRTEIAPARTRVDTWAAGVLGAVPTTDAGAVLRGIACR